MSPLFLPLFASLPHHTTLRPNPQKPSIPSSSLAQPTLKRLKPTRCTPVANREMRLCEIQRYFTDDTEPVMERGVETRHLRVDA
ncbi:unnamed protein product [Litomosoides sigmodontis]|uniref:Uncharacterized protein n=1 Tax=Litomosoides sigmodontis TaxID=42156 RepID=A0A3P6V1H7_LITSI|nr:unnamed protein product [Litomosoides sigmodontis]